MFELGEVGVWQQQDRTAVEQLLLACADAADAALAATAPLEVGDVDSSVLAQVVLRLERARRLLDATEAHALAVLDGREWSDETEGLATSRWLARDAGLPAGVARRRLVVANRLTELPETIDDAFSDGRLGAEHVGVFADGINDRNVDAFTDEQLDRVLDNARRAVFGSWQRSTRSLLERLDPDGAGSRRDELRDHLQLSPSDHFTLLRGELTGSNAAITREALEAVADELFRDWSRDCAAHPELTMPTRPELLAQALVELCRRARAADPTTTRPSRTEVVLTIPAEDPDLALTRWGETYLLGALATLLCDCTLRRMILDAHGVPLDMGRAVRTPTRDQRRALEVRDGGCTFHGCPAPVSWCDAHHLRHWHHDGDTDLDNLVLVCRRHHGIAHRNGWNVELGADGWTTWTTPENRTIAGQRHHQTRGDPP